VLAKKPTAGVANSMPNHPKMMKNYEIPELWNFRAFSI
jgi:hypothetical protein